MAEQGGKTANRSGKTLEDAIEDVLKRSGFVELTKREKEDFRNSDGDVTPFGSGWYVKQMPLDRNIYGARHKSDFFVYDMGKFPEGLHIEAKWQNSAGSVDEKYPFTAMSLVKFRGISIIVIDGGGARPHAIRWLKSYAKKSKGKLSVMTISEFLLWSNELKRG